MARPLTGSARLVPMTLKVDPEIKARISVLAASERRTSSGSASVLLEFALLRWSQEGDLRNLIDQIDQANRTRRPRDRPDEAEAASGLPAVREAAR
jgi:hypothetical protein